MPAAAREDDRVVTGGCQCGAVRFAIEGSRATWSCNVCHCRMCQKAGGGPFMAFVNVPAAAVAWTHGQRATFASSTIASRGFCAACGTPLTYERQPERISVSLGSFDDPRTVVPTSQLVGDEVLAWSLQVATLSTQSLDDWVAGLPTPVLSHQHPDSADRPHEDP